MDWRRLLKVGIGGIKKEAEEALAKLDDAVPGDLEKSFFYRAEIMVADAVIHLAHRHAELAEQKAAECADPGPQGGAAENRGGLPLGARASRPHVL